MTEDIVDTEVFAELCEAMGDDFAAELLDTFLSEAPKMLAALKTAVAEDDADGYRRAAHSIKSNAEIFGATALAGLSRQMELTSLADAPPPVADLDTMWSDTETALKALCDE
ncbi:Hpt domain-containing protein [uncultured Tateyamaria sp.]|uniref:Hpt domain-containing protein n=1 Tax=uncultured Tateyamaria sp. TaxID=455651 RepID=UPI002619C0E9|nr:Hpt domain-containing protein [uncultured Tateyamaria sp.]